MRLSYCAIALVIAGCSSHVQRFPATAPVTSISHDGYEVLLREYVDASGHVDYERWNESDGDVGALDEYLGQLAAASPDSRPELFPTQADGLSYWINLYNAVVVREVLRRWPLESVRDVRVSGLSSVVPGRGFFKDLRFEIAGKPLSLDDIEHEIIRGRYADARVHFAINCGSESCPVLPRDALVGHELEVQLETASRRFINDPANVLVDHDAQAIRLSKIFDWYAQDFRDHVDATVLEFILLYARDALADELRRAVAADYRVSHNAYEWNVNAQTGEAIAEFEFPLLGGGTWKPSDARGKIVLLDFWATWCEPCVDVFPVVQQWSSKYRDDLVVIAVSFDDDIADIREFLEQTGATFPIALDPEQTAADGPLAVTRVPTEIVLDRTGTVRNRHEGLEPGDLDAIEAEIVALIAE